MGCGSSKLDDLAAVSLCRARCNFLHEAIRHRYALADAHVAYLQSLRGVGLSLHHFIDPNFDGSAAPPSPFLPLPTQRKGDPVILAADPPSSSPPPAAVGHHSHSNSGSHINFHSDSDDEDGDSVSLNHSGNSSPSRSFKFQPDYHLDQQHMGSFPDGFMNTNMNYMKNQPTTSVSYEKRPVSNETVQVGESSYYAYNYPNENPSSHPYYTYSNYGGGVNSFFSSPPIADGSSTLPPPPMTATAKPAPPPPSPPRSSAWDFLNPFETLEKYYPSDTPSRNSKDVREEEGIPDLEEEEEIVKEVQVDPKFIVEGGNYSKTLEDESRNSETSLYQTRPSVSVKEEVEYDKNVVANEERSEDHSNVAKFKAQAHFGGDSEIVREIRVQFERAAESGNEVSKMLEAGKHPYQRKKMVHQVSSKMLHVITPSLPALSLLPSTSKSAKSSSSIKKAGSVNLDFHEDVGMRSRNLSFTLQKIYNWEKKLYDEVKAEEKMRIMHERKHRGLKQLDEKGAEAHKVDSARTIVRNLSTKMRIAIQVVDRISVKINKLRDEELWPQINELIHGLFKMWNFMLECHRNQCQAITEAKFSDAILSNPKSSIAHFEAIVQLEQELLNWITNFSSWIGAQKGYVTALNNWLLNCLPQEPEETPDGIAPFSPGRIGAPAVFVICHQWSQAMESISENEVVDSMLALAMSLRPHIDQCRRMIPSGDMERKKGLEREQTLQKVTQVLDKKLALVSGQGSGLIPAESDKNNIRVLQSGLKQIFDAMERFTTNSVQVYEQLQERSAGLHENA